MTTRRRWIAGLMLGFLGVALVVGALNSRSNQPDIQLLILGYTDVPMQFRGCAQELRPSTGLLRKAVLMVTNCGSVPVQALALWDAHGRTNMLDHLHSYVHGIPSVLKPGEAARAMFLSSGRDREIFRAELAYYRLNLSHRLSQRARSSTNAAARAVAKLLPRSPKLRWARSGPITNSYPYRSRYHITAPPPPVPDDLLAPLQFE